MSFGDAQFHGVPNIHEKFDLNFGADGIIFRLYGVMHLIVAASAGVFRLSLEWS